MKKKDISNYRGESPGKKETRILGWQMIKDELDEECFVQGPHLVLASQFAGDVSVLLEMGVDPKGIYAIDRDRHELAAAKSRFADSGVNFKLCNFEDAHSELGVDIFQSAFIDLCGPLSLITLRSVLRIQAKVLGYEFMCCREQGSAARYVREKGRDEHTARGRLAFLKLHGFNPFVGIYYVSKTETTKGEPMCMAIRSENRERQKVQEIELVEVNATYREQRRRITYSKGDRMGKLYNIPKDTVSGWRSWEIRKGKSRREWRSKK